MQNYHILSSLPHTNDKGMSLIDYYCDHHDRQLLASDAVQVWRSTILLFESNHSCPYYYHTPEPKRLIITKNRNLEKYDNNRL